MNYYQKLLGRGGRGLGGAVRDDDGLEINPDGGVVQEGPATYRREGSSGSVTTHRLGGGSMMNNAQSAFEALFANARSPGDQERVRRSFADFGAGAARRSMDSDLADSALNRDLMSRRFDLDSELGRRRLGMQEGFANALAASLRGRPDFFSGGMYDVPPWAANGRGSMGQVSNAERGMSMGGVSAGPAYGLGLQNETRNFLRDLLGRR